MLGQIRKRLAEWRRAAKLSVVAVRQRIASVPSTWLVTLFAGGVGAVAASAAVWAIRLYRRDTRPVYELEKE